MKHTKNSRIQWLHNRISSGSYPNEYRLSEKFGISHRQAQRDIDWLRKELGAPLEYDYSHKGFRYTSDFRLPVYATSGNDDEYAGITEKFRGAQASEETVVQLQIPYTAELEIRDKLAALELQRFVVSSDVKKHRYFCEFDSKELFLGVLMTLNTEIKIISPEWLRQTAVSSAEKMLHINKK